MDPIVVDPPAAKAAPKPTAKPAPAAAPPKPVAGGLFSKRQMMGAAVAAVSLCAGVAVVKFGTPPVADVAKDKHESPIIPRAQAPKTEPPAPTPPTPTPPGQTAQHAQATQHVPLPWGVSAMKWHDPLVRSVAEPMGGPGRGYLLDARLFPEPKAWQLPHIPFAPTAFVIADIGYNGGSALPPAAIAPAAPSLPPTLPFAPAAPVQPAGGAQTPLPPPVVIPVAATTPFSPASVPTPPAPTMPLIPEPTKTQPPAPAAPLLPDPGGVKLPDPGGVRLPDPGGVKLPDPGGVKLPDPFPTTPTPPAKVELPVVPTTPVPPLGGPLTPLPAPPVPGAPVQGSLVTPTLPTPALPNPALAPTPALPNPALAPTPALPPTPPAFAPTITPVRDPAPAPLPPTVTPTVTPTAGVRPEPARPSADPARPPQTSFDVDLHDPKAGDSYDTISRTYYNDARYSRALAAFNKNRPLQGGAMIEVPPVHILRRNFASLVGGAEPLPTTPVGANPEPAFRTAGKRMVVPAGGMSLTAVARQTLGSEARWRELYDLNPQVSPALVVAGTELRLPADANVP